MRKIVIEELVMSPLRVPTNSKENVNKLAEKKRTKKMGTAKNISGSTK